MVNSDCVPFWASRPILTVRPWWCVGVRQDIVRVETIESRDHPASHVFQIILADSSRRTFEASTAEEISRWVTAINCAIKNRYCNKKDERTGRYCRYAGCPITARGWEDDGVTSTPHPSLSPLTPPGMSFIYRENNCKPLQPMVVVLSVQHSDGQETILHRHVPYQQPTTIHDLQVCTATLIPNSAPRHDRIYHGQLAKPFVSLSGISNSPLPLLPSPLVVTGG